MKLRFRLVEDIEAYIKSNIKVKLPPEQIIFNNMKLISNDKGLLNFNELPLENLKLIALIIFNKYNLNKPKLLNILNEMLDLGYFSGVLLTCDQVVNTDQSVKIGVKSVIIPKESTFLQWLNMINYNRFDKSCLIAFQKAVRSSNNNVNDALDALLSYGDAANTINLWVRLHDDLYYTIKTAIDAKLHKQMFKDSFIDKMLKDGSNFIPGGYDHDATGVISIKYIRENYLKVPDKNAEDDSEDVTVVEKEVKHQQPIKKNAQKVVKNDFKDNNELQKMIIDAISGPSDSAQKARNIVAKIIDNS